MTVATEGVSNKQIAWTVRARNLFPRFVIPAAAFVAFIVIWEVVSATGTVSSIVLPSPLSVLDVIWTERALLLEHAQPTTKEILIGFGIAVGVGVPLGILCAASDLAYRSIYPLLVLAQTVPKVAIAPIFVLWLGFELSAKVAITVLIAFFPIALNTISGVRSVPSELRDLGRALRLGKFAAFRRIYLPHALPEIFTGLKLGITLAVIGATVGEFVGSHEGLAYLIVAAQGNLDAPLMFAALTTLTLVGILLYYAIEGLERLFLSWHVSHRGGKL